MLSALLTSVTTEPARASVEVDTSALGDDGVALDQRLTTHTQNVMREAEVLPATSEDDPKIVVRVEALPDGAGYRCYYDGRRRGAVIEGSDATSECRLCTDDELAAHIGGGVERLVVRLFADEAEAKAPPSAIRDPRSVPTLDEPVRWQIGVLGQTGIGLSVGGGFVFGAGLGLALAESLILKDTRKETTPTGTAGLAVATVGVVALGTGITLMLIDRHRNRRRAHRARAGGASQAGRAQPTPAVGVIRF